MWPGAERVWHGQKLVASPDGREGILPAQEPSHSSLSSVESEGVPGKGNSLGKAGLWRSATWTVLRAGRRLIDKGGEALPGDRKHSQYVASGARRWDSKPAPGCVAFGELHNLSVFFDKMGIIKAFSLKSSCRKQM